MPSGFSVSAWFIAAVRAGDRALPVDHRHFPARRLGGFLDALGGAENAAVLQVAGDEDDRLAWARPSARVVGPSHLSARAVAALAFAVAMSMYSSARAALTLKASAQTLASRMRLRSCFNLP